MALKTISKVFGSVLIYLSIIFLTLIFLTSNMMENTNILKSSIDPDKVLDIIAKDQGITVDEMKKICEIDPQQESCDHLKNPSRFLNDELDKSLNQLQEASLAIPLAIISVIVVFLLGSLFIFLGTRNITLTLYNASFAATISSFISFLFFKTSSTSAISAVKNKMFIPEDMPPRLFEIFINAIYRWIQYSLSEVIFLSIILIVAFLILTIIFYFLKKRQDI